MDSKKNEVWTKAPSTKKSAVWNHFLMNKKRHQVKCNHCNKQLSYTSSTYGMLEHLNKGHNINLEKVDPKNPSMSALESSGSIKNWLNDVNENSGEIALSRMAALDMISLLKLATSKDIRDGWVARGLKIPRHCTSQQEMIIGYATKVKNDRGIQTAFRKQ